MEKKKTGLHIKWYLVIEAVIVAALLFCLYEQTSGSAKVPANAIAEAVHEDPDAFKPEWTRADFEEHYAINNEYIAQMRFESGLIDLPVCDADDNGKYLFLNWQTQEYDIFGTVFLEQQQISIPYHYDDILTPAK